MFKERAAKWTSRFFYALVGILEFFIIGFAQVLYKNRNKP